MSMKKMFVVVMCLVFALGMLAQTDPKAKARVAEIRKLYKEAHDAMAYHDSLAMDGLPHDKIVVDGNYMVSGAGPRHEVITFHLSGDFDEERGSDWYDVYFVTRTYNVGAHQFYEEYLYDNNGAPCFCYLHGTDDADARFYWDGDRLIHQDVKGEYVPHIDSITRYANGLKTVFDTLTNYAP